MPESQVTSGTVHRFSAWSLNLSLLLVNWSVKSNQTHPQNHSPSNLQYHSLMPLYFNQGSLTQPPSSPSLIQGIYASLLTDSLSLSTRWISLSITSLTGLGLSTRHVFLSISSLTQLTDPLFRLNKQKS